MVKSKSFLEYKKINCHSPGAVQQERWRQQYDGECLADLIHEKSGAEAMDMVMDVAA